MAKRSSFLSHDFLLAAIERLFAAGILLPTGKFKFSVFVARRSSDLTLFTRRGGNRVAAFGVFEVKPNRELNNPYTDISARRDEEPTFSSSFAQWQRLRF